MITSKNCYMKNQCHKYLSGQCNCDHEDFYCEKLFRIDGLYEQALLTPHQRKYKKLEVGSDNPDISVYNELTNIRKSIDKFVEDGYSLYLFSTTGCGNGKTAWSIYLIQCYLNRIWHKSDIGCRALFISVPKLMAELKNFDNPSDYVKHIEENIESADIVVWDEIGNKVGTQFELDKLLTFINSRINLNKANIYTSNLSGEQLRERLGERLYSRIVRMSIWAEFRGPDMRSVNRN